jgi:hypothetical protein
MVVWLDTFEVFAPTDSSQTMKDPSLGMKDSSQAMKDSSPGMKDSSLGMQDGSRAMQDAAPVTRPYSGWLLALSTRAASW